MATDIDRLIKQLHIQTIAMQQLTEAINSLAGTNMDLVDTVAEQHAAEQDDAEPRFYLDGEPIKDG